jgi:hypothetical protein
MDAIHIMLHGVRLQEKCASDVNLPQDLTDNFLSPCCSVERKRC